MHNDTVSTAYRGGKTPSGDTGAILPYFGFKPTGNVTVGQIEALNTKFNTFIGDLQTVVPGGNGMLLLDACEDLKAAYWKVYGAIAASAVGNV